MPVKSPEEMPRSQRAEGATPIKFPKRPRSAANRPRPDRPGVKKKPQVRGCRTLLGSMVLASTMRNGPAGQPGTWGRSRDGPFRPHQTQMGSPGTFRRFWTEKEAEVPISSPCQGGKTWETVPHDLMTYGTSTPAPEPISKISKEKDRGEKHDVACYRVTQIQSHSNTESLKYRVMFRFVSKGIYAKYLVTLVTLVHQYIWEHRGTNRMLVEPPTSLLQQVQLIC